MKLAIGGLSHETNCFSPVATPLSSWKIAEGEDLLKLRGTKTNVGGILEVADREGWELLPTLLAAAVPSKPTDAGTYANLKERIFSPMRREKPDAVILCMHGAMMAEGTDDPEGDLVSAARKIIGDRPLIITLDLHGNNTKETALGSDGVFGFDTNPHIDAYERALEAAECLAKALKGEWKPVTAHAHAPMLPPTINMRTAEGPMAALFARAREWEAKPGMINVSVFGGFPYCDVPYVGLNVIATADNDKELAQAACDDICARAWENRDQFLKKIAPISEAMEQAKALVAKNPKLPVIIADVADNPGGGGSGDTPELLRAIIESNIPGTAAAVICDPETVQKALKIGVGNIGSFTIAGKAEPAYGLPIVAEAKVKAIADGNFIATGPMGRGNPWDMGVCARLEVGNVDILVCSTRIACNDADIFRHLGVEPSQKKLLLIKSRGHFRASFEPLASSIIEVDAPGAANPNLKRYSYQKIAAWPLNVK